MKNCGLKITLIQSSIFQVCNDLTGLTSSVEQLERKAAELIQ